MTISETISRTRKSGFRCPKCDGFTWAVDSRPSMRGTWRRRRACPCGFRFTTLEMPIDEAKDYSADRAADVRAAARLLFTAIEAVLEARHILAEMRDDGRSDVAPSTLHKAAVDTPENHQVCAAVATRRIG